MVQSSPKDLLQNIWNYPDFLYPQEEIISSVLSGKDTLALLPTGGGKSLCYQIPALMQEGVTVVISPLMALIKDQIKELQTKGIKAIYLSAEQSFLGQIDVFDYVRDSGCKLLYVAPERLQNPVFQQSLKSLSINLIAVDEAHCISEWGNDFRPSYTHIKSFREKNTEAPIIALTASATPQIQEDIIEKLGLQNPQVFKKSFARPNLATRIQKSENKFQHILHFLEAQQGSGILYVRTRAESENIAKQLQQNGHSAAYFHAGLHEKKKNVLQADWMQNKTRVLVATNAFGMGINKSDVRFIIHYNLPYSIENYYQEIGRAGRDGKEAQTLLLYNDFDINQTYTQFKTVTLSEKEYRHISKKLFTRWQWAKNELPEAPYYFDFQKFCHDYQLYPSKVKTLLQFFHNSGILYWNTNPKNSQIQLKFSPHQIDDLQGFEKTILESLTRNISGIYNEMIPFSEKYWANHLHVSQVELHHYFQKWQKQGLIEYENGSLHTIQIVQPRENQLIYGRMLKSFLHHQKQKRTKLKNLFFLTRNEKECRMQLLMRYFGERLEEKCNHCDVCTQHEKSDEYQLSDYIFEFIRKSPRTLAQILSEFSPKEADEIIDSLQVLIQENKIENKNYFTYSIKEK